ncbi:site-specific integrase [Bradyrhizobium sp. CCGUVB4N]|uniref:tyrosine-type recombinase/integrase n=1 Tax=Bradyrhizobium sp. CCGUVB4N TaxID=2949631 RepID=UPI0020B3D4CA|nr:site-specific integrase [Bradyrhizobium sp. CCGUVB4N]MCP3381259.1 site-specific integrase [Bradyrhizobium sp. CCGUVB4N]
MSVRKRTWKAAEGVEKTAWVVNYTDQAGKRRLKTFDKKKAADDFDATVRNEVQAGIHTPDRASVTVGEAGDRWLASCESIGLERTTIDAYRSHLDLHIKPFLGARKLSQLTVPMITDFERKLRDGTETEKPRSAAMVKRVRADLGSLLANAQEEGLVARNVVREVRAKRRRGKERQAERRAKPKLRVGVDIPTPLEIRAIVGVLQGKWRPLFLTVIFTGLRASELRGLRWVNVDLAKRELHVRERADEYNQLGRPKSESGERSIPLPPVVVSALREWKLQCPKTELGLVFPSPVEDVEIIGRDYIVKRGLWPAHIAAGITKIGKDSNGKVTDVAKYPGLHSLRHFFASWCINRKVDGGLELPPKVVQERLGHSTIAMTLDIYGHLFPRHDDSEELAAAEKALLG